MRGLGQRVGGVGSAGLQGQLGSPEDERVKKSQLTRGAEWKGPELWLWRQTEIAH